MMSTTGSTDGGDRSVVVFGCDRWPLHFACRTDNFKQVKYMIDTLGFDYDKINEADDHNATPLYHAALIGSTDICRFLLQRGAVCTENDSARVFYVALTPALRNILRDWSLSAASVDPYLQSLQLNFTMNNNTSVSIDDDDDTTNSGVNVGGSAAAIDTTDCAIHIWSTNDNDGLRHIKTKHRSLRVHRIMLKYRCPFLFCKIEGQTDDNDDDYFIDLIAYDKLHCDVLVRIVEYMYNGKMELLTLNIAFLCIEVMKEWGLDHELYSKIQSAIDQHLLQVKQQKEAKNNIQFENNCSSIVTRNKTKLSWTRTTNPVVLASLGVPVNNATNKAVIDDSSDAVIEFQKFSKSDINRLLSDMGRLAQYVSTPQIATTTNVSDRTTSDIDATFQLMQCSDLMVCCHTEIYHVHRFRLIQHSEYFLCALKGNFRESLTSSIDLSAMISVDATETLPLIIQWMYTDGFLYPHDVTINTAIELIQVCTALLCSPRLFSYVVNTVIVPNLSVDTVFNMLEFTRTHPGSVGRLESKCCEVIALHLEDILSNAATSDEVRYIVEVEISAIRQGGDIHETDIPLIAELRRAINRLVNTTNEERIHKLNLLKAFVTDVAYQIQQEQLSS